MSAYQVTREGQNLGSFEMSQIQEGLQTGSLLATDWGWCEGMSGWQGLAEIAAAAPPPKTKGISSPLSAPVKKGAGVKNDSLNPYAAPASNTQAAPSGTVPAAIISELKGTRPWVRLISVVMWVGFSLMMLHFLSFLVFGAAGVSSLAKVGYQGLGVGVMICVAIVYGIIAMLIIYPAMKLTKYATNISRLADSVSFEDLAAALAEQRRFWKFHGILLTINLSMIALFLLLILAGAGFGSLSR